jgi:hypothetical protein
MDAVGQAVRVGRELAGVLPRSIAALNSAGSWNSLSPSGIRRLGEVALDEAVVTGMTLMAPPPILHTDPASYVRVADELSDLGIAGAYAEPKPLLINHIHRRRAGLLEFEQLTFDHDPALPDAFSVADVTGPATAVCNVLRHGGGPRPWLVWVHGAGMGCGRISPRPGSAASTSWATTSRCRSSPGTGHVAPPGRPTPTRIR